MPKLSVHVISLTLTCFIGHHLHTKFSHLKLSKVAQTVILRLEDFDYDWKCIYRSSQHSQQISFTFAKVIAAMDIFKGNQWHAA